MIKKAIKSIIPWAFPSVNMGRSGIRRDAAKRTGSFANWVIQRLFSKEQEALERRTIVDRSINLVNDNPDAAGIIETLATTIIGPGLKPHPALDAELLGLAPEKVKLLRKQQKSIYRTWATQADVAGRMTDGEIQHLKARCLFGLGESLEILYMVRDKDRPYSLASQVIHPSRLKTPTDKRRDGNIKDGIEIHRTGAPRAYWIKRVSPDGKMLSDTSANFVRIPIKKRHRWQVLHDFVTKDPEQFRGYPIFSPSMRYFRDLSDLLGAELTTSVVSAAIGLFVETENPDTVANLFQNKTDYDEDERIQELMPGAVWYGEAGQKPHLISANRPSTTFEPFTKMIKKSIAMSTGIPYPVLFKDVDGISFAGFRSAMLEAWRVYDYHRRRIGGRDCTRKYAMLVEEAYLRGELALPGFYERPHLYCAVDWYGPPKGDIEPFKAIMADMEKFKARVKPLERIIIEDGGAGFDEVIGQIEEEVGVLREKDLLIGAEQDAVEANELMQTPDPGGTENAQ